ncbi:hypothetical protein KF707_13740 [Candidatus Obscuribacterales bacterium]|jgi:hypothetical protein|nr:hypothetical protein [Candidatus Obscuribacterales bacterium]MBX3137300.1 hypothetical protein [Candidatus Obscuribacterales bacterium]MBX3149758.1 hypothetical protein [Candidatus Obscuribacterales bacterium]
MSKVVYSDRHLTDNGWVTGTERWDDGTLKLVNPPSDTAMTVRYSVPMHRPPYITTQWKTDRDEYLQELVQKFGELPNDLKIVENTAGDN